MSLQVCHCGWSKVTTHHGLRTHQGKMGCTLKGARVAKSATQQQQYTQSTMGLTYTQKDLMLDVYATFKTDSADCYSETSLQVCQVCGWSKMTTYQGLRIHQGRMGCTPKGKRIPKSEQYDWTNQWEMEEEKKKYKLTKTVIKKENLSESADRKVCKTKVKEEYNLSYSSLEYYSQRSRSSTGSGDLVNRSVRERPTLTLPEAVVRPKEKIKKHQRLLQRPDIEGTNSCTDYATIAVKIKEEPKSPSMVPQYSSQGVKNSREMYHQQDFSTVQQANQLTNMEAPSVLVVGHKKKVRNDPLLSQNAPMSSRNNPEHAANTKEEPKPPFSNPIVTNSDSGNQLQDSSNGGQVNKLIEDHQPPPSAAVVQPKEKHGDDQSWLKNTQDSTNISTQLLAAEPGTKEAPEPCTAVNEMTEPDFSTSTKVKKLAQMFSAFQATAVQPKKKNAEEPKLVKLNVHKFWAAKSQEAAAQPKEKDTDNQQIPPVINTKGSATQMNTTAAKTTKTQDPKPTCESVQLSDFTSGMKVKDLACMFSAATNQETFVRPKRNHREEPKLSQAKPFPQSLSSTTAQETKLCTEDQHKEETQKRNIDLVFSEVMKVVQDAKQKSCDLPLSNLRTTTLTMIEQVNQKLDELSVVELQWISKFSVNIKLDPTTAHQCLASGFELKVMNSRENQEAGDTPGSPGCMLGLNSLPTDKSYWEVEVSTNTGWSVGVARGNTNHKVELVLNPAKGYWVITHYENKAYAALAAQTVHLALKQKPQKIGVFVDYKEKLVSFYDVTARSHIYSFTGCLFSGEIFPYFCVHPTRDGSTADPLRVLTTENQ